MAYAPLFAQAANVNGCESRIAKAVSYLKKVGTEEALMNAWYFMYDDTTQAKHIKSSILKKYPKGLMAMKAKWDEKIDYGNPDAVKKHFLDFFAASPYNSERETYLERFGQQFARPCRHGNARGRYYVNGVPQRRRIQLQGCYP